MYAVYNYKAGSTPSQITADLALIGSGTTNPASLSASCVQANTSISTAISVAGWTVHDAAAGGTAAQVLKSTNQDGSTFKFLYLDATSGTVLSLRSYEDWNAGANTGTNATGSAAVSRVIDATGGGYIYLFVDQKNFVFFSWTSAGYSNSFGSIFEFLRDSQPAGYPCHVFYVTTGMGQTGNGPAACYCPRLKNPIAAGDLTGAGANCGLGHITVVSWGANPTGSSNTAFRDAADVSYQYTYKMGMSGGTANNVYWPLGVGYSIRLLPSLAAISSLDTINYSGVDYVAFKGTNDMIILVPKG